MLAAVEPVGSELVALSAARGRTLGAPVVAARAQPPFAASAMDGYALRARDTPGALRIVGEAAAGHAFEGELAKGEAVRISTGAPMPAGADAVLIQEDARLDGEGLIANAVEVRRHVRAAGIDFTAGTEVLLRGQRLDSVSLALAAAAGAAKVEARLRPRVTILCAGDEIVPPGAAPREEQIFESCSYAIAAQAEEWGAMAERSAALPDDPGAIERAARDASLRSDLVVFIGSASVGPHDHARQAFERAGAHLLVRKVDMRPGKPTWFATTPGAPVLGLPGNPASAIVASILFLRPLLARLLGGPGDVELGQARLGAPLSANGDRETYLRANLSNLGGELRIRAATAQDSSLLAVFARSNALLIRPPGAAAAEIGEVVQFLRTGAANF